jgi:heat shock protein HslJ
MLNYFESEMIRITIPSIFLFLLFIGCTGAEKINELGNHEWKVTSIMGKSINPGNQPDGFPIINFSDNNKLFGSTGCNKFIGSFKLDKNSISLEPGALTKMFCPDSPEQDFLSAVRKVTRYKFEGEALKLLDGSTTLMTLVPAGK